MTRAPTVPPSTNPTGRAAIAFERRRMMQVRASLEMALAAGPVTPADIGFLVAAGEYLCSSIGRLQAQDALIHQCLEERLPRGASEAWAHLRSIQGNLAVVESSTARFANAVKALRERGAAGLAAFEPEVRAFAASFGTGMAPRKNPMSVQTDVLLHDEDWERISLVTARSIAEEERLFRAVCASAGPERDPSGQAAVH